MMLNHILNALTGDREKDDAVNARAQDDVTNQATVDTTQEQETSVDQAQAQAQPAPELGHAPIPGEGAWINSAKAYNRRRPFTRAQWVEIQQALQTDADGLPGTKTARAVYRWQVAQGLGTDGKLGPATYKSITDDGPVSANTPQAKEEEPEQKADEQAQEQEDVNYDQVGPPPGTKVIPDAPAAMYSYLKTVITSQGGSFSSKPMDMNLIGIRGVADGIRVNNTKDAYDDTIFAVWIDINGAPQARSFKGSVDPGKFAKYYNPAGDANLMDGQWSYKTGTHKGYTALNQAEAVGVWRDKDKDGEREAGDVEQKGWYGINIHAAGSGTKVGNWSAGCQVIWGGRGPNSPFAEFMKLMLADPDQKFEYTLVDGSKLPYASA